MDLLTCMSLNILKLKFEIRFF